MAIKLDFTINTAKARQEYIDNCVRENKEKNLKEFTKKELELMGDYILYGKDEESGKSIVDTKEISINTKHSSYKKKEPESLEALMDNPAFNEGIFIKHNTHFKKIKPTIDRELDKDIPSMQELWKEIDKLRYILDVAKGKIEDPNVRIREGLELYKLKHFYITLCRQQYYLKDIFHPAIFTFKGPQKVGYYEENNSIPWCAESNLYDIAPIGLITDKPERFLSPRNLSERDYKVNLLAKNLLDFRNPDHIYLLFENYEDLAISQIDVPESTINSILETIDFYTDFAHLSDSKKEILRLKKLKYTNDQIQKILSEKFGLSHTANYISTIWKQKICVEISEAATLHFEYYMERENPLHWKECNTCGKTKLRDSREFVRKAKSSDGLSNRCKVCDKEKREKEKIK